MFVVERRNIFYVVQKKKKFWRKTPGDQTFSRVEEILLNEDVLCDIFSQKSNGTLTLWVTNLINVGTTVLSKILF